jgi:putative transcriptional regulator
VLGPVGAIDLSQDPHEVMSDLGMLRVFAGYSGWGPQQLEGELEVGAWLVVDAEPADLLCRQPDQLWRDVLRRQGGRTAWLAEFPPELSRN